MAFKNSRPMVRGLIRQYFAHISKGARQKLFGDFFPLRGYSLHDRNFSMVFKATITIEWNGWGQPSCSMVFRWSLGPPTIVSRSPTIVPVWPLSKQQLSIGESTISHKSGYCHKATLLNELFTPCYIDHGCLATIQIKNWFACGVSRTIYFTTNPTHLHK